MKELLETLKKVREYLKPLAYNRPYSVDIPPYKEVCDAIEKLEKELKN